MSYETVCSPDGSLFACVGQRVNVFEVESRQRVLSTRPFPHPSHADFSPDNKKLAIKLTSGRIAIVNIARGDVLQDFKNQKEGEGSEIFFSPDGRELVDGSWKGLVSIRKLRAKVATTEEFSGEMINRLSHDADKKFWLMQHSRKLKPGQNWPDYDYLILHQWPIFKGEQKLFSFDHYLESATISPDGSRICFIGWRRGGANWLRIVRCSDSEVIAASAEIEIGGTGGELAWSSDSSLIGSVQKRRFVFYRASDLGAVGELQCQYPSSVCFLPKGDLVVLGTWNSSVLATTADILMGRVKLQ